MNALNIRSTCLLTLVLTGCAFPGLIWERSKWDGPIVEEERRSPLMYKCDAGPSGISDRVYCKWAFVDRSGTKVELNEIGETLDNFLPQVEQLSPWVGTAGRHGSDATNRTKFPYRLHILTVTPIVVLAVPRSIDDAAYDYDYGSGPPASNGRISSSRIRGESYWYRRDPKRVTGTFWFSPSLNVKATPVPYAEDEVVIDLPDSKLRLKPKGVFWNVSRGT